MSYLNDTIDWQAITKIDNWLDSRVGVEYWNQPLAQDWARVSKIGEELGEAINELIKATGQNPRKGIDVDSWDKLRLELADVVFTGILAIQHFTKDSQLTRDILMHKLATIETRIS